MITPPPAKDNSMKKKLYFQLSDNCDIQGLTMELSGCMEMIQSEMEFASPDDAHEFEFTLKPIWLTDKEFKNLPEYEG